MMYGANNLCSVQRLVADVAGKKSFDSAYIYQNEPAYIEPLNPQMAVIFSDQNAFRMFRIWFDGKLDIRITDKITDSDGKEYFVEGNEPFSNNTDTGDVTRLTCALRYPST